MYRVWENQDSSLFYIRNATPTYMHNVSVDALEWDNDNPQPSLVLYGPLLACYALFEDISSGIDIEIHLIPCGPPHDYDIGNTHIKILNCQVVGKWIADITLIPNEYEPMPVLIYLHLRGENIVFHSD